MKIRKCLAIALAAAMFLSVGTGVWAASKGNSEVKSASASEGTASELSEYAVKKNCGLQSNNIGAHSYNWGVNWGRQENAWNWQDPANSFLAVNSDGTFTRVECSGGQLTVEDYSSTFGLKSTKTLSFELPIFGGFFSGAKYNFIVFGKENPDDSDSAEVLRVVKYDKSWNRKGSKAFYGINTHVPFDAGAVSMAEDANRLYIHTCHKMYTTGDGYNHQANLTFYINQQTLSAVYENYDIWNISTGYVSHSFNQVVRADGQHVYTVDHGDAYPRMMVLVQRDLSGEVEKVEDILPIEGECGDNETKATLGDMQLSDTHVFTVGTSVLQDEQYDSRRQKNVFLSICPKEDIFDSSVVWLTEYGENAGVTVCNPYLVKTGDNSFTAVWEELSSSGKKIKFAKINGTGNRIYNGDSLTESSAEGLSDCAPVISNGKIVWYSTGDRSNLSGKTNPTFYAVPVNFPPRNVTAKVATTSSVKLTWNLQGYYSSAKVYQSTSETGTYTLVGTYAGNSATIGGLNMGTTYYFKVAGVTADGTVSDYSSPVSARPIPSAPYNVSATPESFTTVRLKWTTKSPVQFVEVWRTHKANAVQSEYVQLGIYNASDGTSLSRSLTPGKTYYYKLRGYAYNSDNKKVYSGYSTIVSATPKALTPYNVKATPQSTTTVKIEWTAPPDTQFVEVWRTHKANAEQKDYVQLGIYYASAGTSMSRKLTPGKTYYYKLRGYSYNKDNKKEYSPYSTIVSATPPTK